MNLRDLPSIDLCLRAADDMVLQYGRPLTYRAFVWVLDEARQMAKTGEGIPTLEEVIVRANRWLRLWTDPRLLKVINATGVVLHTNLGRAPLSKAAIVAMAQAGENYTNLEFDLATGKRGKRDDHIGHLLHTLTGAEESLVVNNCASAVLLTLSALAKGKQVLIPRSQLVEIGGGFRVPDVMKQSGAKLVEIGTTNKVNLNDQLEKYDEARNPADVISFVAHRSNFQIIGFTEEPTVDQMAVVAHQFGSILVYDLGSGAMLDTAKYGMQHEPTVVEALTDGADLVLFSGDKLLGGPQAGIVVGKRVLLDKLKKHPLARAVRADKTTLAGLATTLTHYLKDEAEREIPIWRSISATPDWIKARCEKICAWAGVGEVIPTLATVGGGSLPGETLPSWALAIRSEGLQASLALLRKREVPIVARVENNLLMIDPRCVEESDDEMIAQALREIYI